MNIYKSLFLIVLSLVCAKRVLVALLRVKSLHAAVDIRMKEGKTAQNRNLYLRAYYIWSAMRAMLSCSLVWCLIWSDAFAFVFSLGRGNARIGEILIYDTLWLLVVLRSGISAWVDDHLSARYQQEGGYLRGWVRISVPFFAGALLSTLAIVLLADRFDDSAPVYMHPAVCVLIALAIITGCLITYRFFEQRSRQITSLQDCPLKEKLQQLACKEEIRICNIDVVGLESDYMAFNASCLSLGRYAWLSFGRPMLDKHGEDATLASLAHELGHAKHRDSQKTILIHLAGNLLAFFLWCVTRRDTPFFSAFGFLSPSLVFSFALFFSYWYFFLLDVVFCIPLKWFARREESRADAFAVDAGFGEGLYRTLLDKDDIEVTGKWLLRFAYSYPKRSVRLNNIKQRMAKQDPSLLYIYQRTAVKKGCSFGQYS